LIGQVSGSGDLDAQDCPVREADIRVSGSGSVRCDVTQHLKARVSGSGNVWYEGNPTLDVDISGSGKVRKL
jgi:Putative auto-transporter adhesin, head GIN domain